MKAGIVVIVETWATGLTPASREIISFSHSLAADAGETMLVLVPGGITNPVAEEIAAAAGGDVVVLVGKHLSAYSAEAWGAALSPVCKEIDPRFICLPHTSRGWDYGPGLAVRLGASLIGAVESFRLQGGNFFFKRSLLKGQWQMDVLPETWPVVLTILPEARGTEGAAPRPADSPGRPPGVSFLSLPSRAFRTKTLGSVPAPETAYDFSEAEVIVATGKGIGAPENIDLIKRLAGIFPKSAVGCSRAVCDLGWMEYRRQIGMTGRTVSPPLYIACGISGAMPHLAGMRNSRCIIAVNRDKNAAIFQIAHLGIREDLLTFIPAVLEQAASKKQENSNG